jgi:hypothetical protein
MTGATVVVLIGFVPTLVAWIDMVRLPRRAWREAAESPRWTWLLRTFAFSPISIYWWYSQTRREVVEQRARDRRARLGSDHGSGTSSSGVPGT